MAPEVKWSPDFLFREVPAGSATARFLYPSRQVSLAFLLGAGIGGAALLCWSSGHPSERVAQSIVGGLFMAGMLAVSLRAVLNQRLLLVDASARELRLLRRIPFRTRMETVAFSELRSVHLLDPNPSDPSPERSLRVSLRTVSGTEIVLGRESRGKALGFGNRLSGLIGIPIERSMTGT